METSKQVNIETNKPKTLSGEAFKIWEQFIVVSFSFTSIIENPGYVN
jgi:hypothetical protein